MATDVKKPPEFLIKSAGGPGHVDEARTATAQPEKAWPHLAMGKGDGASGTVKVETTIGTRSVIETLKAMREQDANDYEQIILALTSYARQRRADLEQFEHWLGI